MTLFTMLLVMIAERLFKLGEHWHLDHRLEVLFRRIRHFSMLVIDGEEGDASFRISASTHPSAHGDLLVNGDTALEYVGYRHNAHNILSVNSRKK